MAHLNQNTITPSTHDRQLSRASASPPYGRPQPRCLDLAGLRGGIADRQQQLADLEAEMVADCEAAAAANASPGFCIQDRETWDRATWDRYLAAATTLEPVYGPRLRRLYGEIDQLKRLAALPLAA